MFGVGRLMGGGKQSAAAIPPMPMNLPVIATGTYELILASDLGVVGSPVDSWTDQSANGYVAAGSGATRPTVNGTDGSKQTLRWASTSKLIIPNFALSSSFTMFVRADPDQASGWGILIEHGDQVDSQEGFLFNHDKPHGDNNFGGINRTATGLRLQTWALAEVVETRSLWILGYNAATQVWTMKQDGVDITQANGGGNPPLTETVVTAPLNIGIRGVGGVLSTCWHSSIVICEGALSGAEITAVSDAINAYFA